MPTDWSQYDISELGPVIGSIVGSQDREFAHASSMQSQDLSARAAMNKASLANSLKMAKLQYETQRYGIDVNRDVSYRGQDFEKETAYRGQDFQKETAFRGQDFEQMQARWTNAMNYLSLASQLRGPENYFQQANLYRGAAGSDFPAFLSDLMSDQGIGGMVSGASNLQGFGAQSGSPTPASIQGLAQGLTSGVNPGQPTGAPGAPGSGGVAGAPGTPGQGLVGSISQIAQNMHRLAPGALEALTDTELKLFGSGAEAGGHDLPSLLDVYARSRPSQGSARAA